MCGAPDRGTMAIIEAQLVYRPHGIGSEGVVPLGSTCDAKVLRAMRDALLEQARQVALVWRGIDPGVLAMKQAEYERLAQVLAVLLPDEDLRADLRVVREGPRKGQK